MSPSQLTLAHAAASSTLLQRTLLAAIFGFVLGTDLIIKEYLPGGIGPLAESTFRWLPAFLLIGLALAAGALVSAPASPLILIFLLLVFQSVLRSPDQIRSAIEFLREMPVYLMALLIPAGLIAEKSFWTAIFAATFAICILSLLTAIAVPHLAYTGYEWGLTVRRLEGVAPQTVSLGFASGLSVVLGLGLTCVALKSGRPRKALLLFVLTLISALCLLETQSRGPLAGALLGATTVLALNLVVGRARDIVFLGLGVFLPVLLGAIYLVLLLVPLDHILAFSTGAGDRMMTLAERALIWNAARGDISVAPFWGQGYRLDVYIDHYLADEDGIYPSYHSAFLGVWRDAGVFAFVALLLIVLTAYVRSLTHALSDPTDYCAPIRVGLLALVLLCGSLDSSLSGGVMLMAAFGAFAFSHTRAAS